MLEKKVDIDNAHARLAMVRGAITLPHDAILANNEGCDELIAAHNVLDMAREEIDRINVLLEGGSLARVHEEVANA